MSHSGVGDPTKNIYNTDVIIHKCIYLHSEYTLFLFNKNIAI